MVEDVQELETLFLGDQEAGVEQFPIFEVVVDHVEGDELRGP